MLYKGLTETKESRLKWLNVLGQSWNLTAKKVNPTQ